MQEFEWSKESEKQWNKNTESWHAKSREMWEYGSRKDILPFFSEHVPPGKTVCDLGCGDGYGSFKLAQAGYSVTGIDVSCQMISKAIEINRENSSRFIKADISSIPFSSDTFDAVLAINSLEWTEEPLKVLLETQRVVKPGGFACFGILGPTAAPRINSFRRLYNEKVICNTMMPWEFEKLAIENNWTKIKEFGVYKRGAEQISKGSLSRELRQSLSFMWVFMLRNNLNEKKRHT